MASKREVVVATENYLRSKGYNNSTGKYDRVIMGVKSLLGETLLAYGSPEFERAIQQETERMLKKYVKDSAIEYDPILRMNVPVVTNDAEVAWQEFDRNDRVVTKRKEFKSIEAAEKFIEKVSEKNNFYRILATSDERTWDNAIQAADAFVPADEALLKQIEYKLKNLGWTINSKQKYSMYGGSFHYQMTYKEKIDPKNEAQFMKIAKPAADVIDREAKDYVPTFNFGLGKDGSVTCGFDIRSKYVGE